MPNAARVVFKTTNQTQRTTTPLAGLTFVLGQTLRGPDNDPKTIINSWEQFKRVHGGIPNTADLGFVLQCKKILESGGKLRVCRVTNHLSLPYKPVVLGTKLGEFDADLEAGDVLTITVDGTALGTVNFNSTHIQTMNDVMAMLITHSNISSAVLDPSDLDKRAIYISQTDVAALLVTAITNTGTAAYSESTNSPFINVDGDQLFSLKMKYTGIDYSNIIAEVTPSTNGQSDQFGIHIYHATDTSLNETYNNLKIIPGTDSSSHFLDIINANSDVFEVDYVDTSAITEIDMLTGMKYGYINNGTTDPVAVVGDYIGDSATGTGLFSFDDYDDALQIAVLNQNETMVGLHEGGSSYAYNRKDLVYFAHLSNASTTKDLYITARGTNINNKFCAFYGGGVKLTNPYTSLIENYPELADIIIAANRSDEDYSPYYSFAGPNRGLIFGILGIVNNYGSNAKYPDLNELANSQINMAINRDGKNMLWGNFTSQIDDNQEKYLHIVRGMITMIKTLRPTLETFLEEPCAPPTWNRMYYTVKPFLDGLLGEFFHTYEWVGDQFATGVTDNDLQVNTAADVADGKYKAKLVVTLIASMQEIEIEIISTVAGVQVQF